jgi:hypothetical protein
MRHHMHAINASTNSSPSKEFLTFPKAKSPNGNNNSITFIVVWNINSVWRLREEEKLRRQ